MSISAWPRAKNPLFFFLAAAFLVVILRSAWMDEDAYITLRTVDNFVHGYGLVWNVGERVQTFTHPLWMFMLAALYFFTHEAFYTSLALCLVTSLAALFVIGRLVQRKALAPLAILAILLFSKAFVEEQNRQYCPGCKGLTLDQPANYNQGSQGSYQA